MASIAFQKVKNKSSVAAIMRHNDRDERMLHEHANKEINKEVTYKNKQWLSYEDSYQRFKDRLDELDSTTNTNHRKDRVEAVAITIPMPEEGMTEDNELKVAKTYLEFIAKRYGQKNVCGFWYHQDEKHEYRDNLDGKIHQSRGHVHFIVVPEVDGKLNCKQFTSKRAMITANKDLDTVIRKEFGMSFLTGEEPKKQTVEDLKRKGEEMDYDRQIKELQEKQEAKEREILKLEKDLGDKGKRLETLISEITEINYKIDTAEVLKTDGEEFLDLVEEYNEYERRREAFDKIKSQYNNSHHGYSDHDER